MVIFSFPLLFALISVSWINLWYIQLYKNAICVEIGWREKKKKPDITVAGIDEIKICAEN